MEDRGPGAPHPHLQVSGVHTSEAAGKPVCSCRSLQLCDIYFSLRSPMSPPSAHHFFTHTLPALSAGPWKKRRRSRRRRGAARWVTVLHDPKSPWCPQHFCLKMLKGLNILNLFSHSLFRALQEPQGASVYWGRLACEGSLRR